MSTATIDLRSYRHLVARAAPVVIRNEKDNDRMLAVIEELMAKGEDNLTPEEDALLELLTGLVHDFESRRYPIPRLAPRRMVAYLLEQKRLKPRDLWPVLGAKSRVSEILSGERSISKAQAKKLAEFFRVSVDLFL